MRGDATIRGPERAASDEDACRSGASAGGGAPAARSGPTAGASRARSDAAAAARAPGTERAPARARLRPALTTAATLAILWAALNPGDLGSWAIGAPAVLLGAATTALFPAAGAWRLSPRGAVAFAWFFAVETVRGAVDVILRAFDPRLPLKPGFRTIVTDLPEGAARLVFANTISLLPGTLTAEMDGDVLTLHLIDAEADVDADLDALDARVRALFALPPRVAP